MHIRDWLTELRNGCIRVIRRPKQRRCNFPRRSPNRLATLTAALAEHLEPRILLSASNPLELSSLLTVNGGTGAVGFTIDGVAANDGSSRSVANAGDVNGDGLDDLLIGADRVDPGGRTNAGASYLVFGTVEGTQASLSLSSLNGTNGFALNGIAAGDNCGVSVSSAGDVNGDGYVDLLIGAPHSNINGHFSGQTYVVFGGMANLTALDSAGGRPRMEQSSSRHSMEQTDTSLMESLPKIDSAGRSIAQGM